MSRLARSGHASHEEGIHGIEGPHVHDTKCDKSLDQSTTASCPRYVAGHVAIFRGQSLSKPIWTICCSRFWKNCRGRWRQVHRNFSSTPSQGLGDLRFSSTSFNTFRETSQNRKSLTRCFVTNLLRGFGHHHGVLLTRRVTILPNASGSRIPVSYELGIVGICMRRRIKQANGIGWSQHQCQQMFILDQIENGSHLAPLMWLISHAHRRLLG